MATTDDYYYSLIKDCSNWKQFEKSLEPLEKHQKGRIFEELTKLLFLTHPIYLNKLARVWHHSEIPNQIIELLQLPNPEIGVDLVAQARDGSFWLIQCKFHQDPEVNVSYQEVSTFLSISERSETFKHLSHRLISTSANGVSPRVSKSHSSKLGYLTASDFLELDFNVIHTLIDGKSLVFKPKTPREHQTRAVSKATEYFSDQSKSRGKIIHPCGAGKSLTSFWLSQSLHANSILIAVPSLSLVKQTVSTWSREALANNKSLDWIAICSDETTGSLENRQSLSAEIGIEVDTDPEIIKKFFSKESSSSKIFITTYQSGKTLGDVAREMNHIFDLGIFDEAHKTVGNRDKTYAHLLLDENIQIKRRVFMTATERQFKGESTNILTMDDRNIYGEVIDEFSFKEAIECHPAILCDYKVVTTLMTKSFVDEFTENNGTVKSIEQHEGIQADRNAIAALIAINKLIDKGLAKHIISFHNTISRSKNFMNLVKYFSSISGSMGGLQVFHLSGKDNSGTRSKTLRNFESSNLGLITNARCLTEGVDVPLVDTILFADPKQSTIDIVQAAGRAMRIHPDKQTGYILLPVVVDDELDDPQRSAFQQIISVLSALGMHDSRIIDEFKDIVSGRTKKGNIVEIMSFQEDLFKINPDRLAKEIDILVWDRLSFAKSIIGESGFTKWMNEETNLSDKSVKNYTQAVRKISNDLVRMGLTKSTLEEILESEDLNHLKKSYFEIPEFKESDLKGKNMYSAGFNKLIEYQSIKKSNHL